MHIFLTGALQAGKSTAIDRFLDRTGIEPGGFCTRWDRQAGRLELFLLGREEREPLVVARMTGRGVQVDTAAFDEAGRLLLTAPAAPLVLMDELGFLESKSQGFQQAVFALLDGPAHVLGVLRTHPDSVFAPYLSGRADVTLLPLTPENRDQIPGRLADLLCPGRA